MAETDTDDWGQLGRPMAADRQADEALILDIDGFEGPLDLLLMLSRTQKVDLRRISVLHCIDCFVDSCHPDHDGIKYIHGRTTGTRSIRMTSCIVIELDFNLLL